MGLSGSFVVEVNIHIGTGIFRRIRQADCTRPYRAQVLGPFGRGEQLLPQEP